MKLSIIIPVYEPGGFLEACLESVCNQRLDEMEVVLVDDCGKDGSVAFAEKYLYDHSPELALRVVRMPSNGGPAAARNAGLAVASGQYVSFLDADDRLYPDFCASLYSAAVSSKADIACCDILVRDGDKSRIVRNPRISSGSFTISLHRKYLREYVSYFTTYIYRRRFLEENGIVFPDSRSAEDSCFLACAILAAQRIARVNEPLYVYEKRLDSVSGKRNRRRGLQRIRSFEALRRWAQSHGMQAYRSQINWISFKKGCLLALRDLITG